jgi:6-phosphogluconate dehydrogenase
MGGNLSRHAKNRGFRVVGYDSENPETDLADAGVEVVSELKSLREKLDPPRIVFIYVPAGPIVDTVIDDLSCHLDPGDILVDGGNSYWGDSIRRHDDLAKREVHFVDLGTSGGVSGALHGACFMAGGEADAVARVEPILQSLAVDGGYVHAGPPGAGHFVKLVHNGIEFGMLQAIAEGTQLLEHYRDTLPIADVLHCWSHGSVIRSWLIELLEQEYRKQRGLKGIADFIEDTGEVNWLVDDAMHMEVPVPVTALSVMQLIASRDRSRDWTQAIAAMRHGFGGHPYGPDESIARERREGRVGGFPVELDRNGDQS